MGDLMLAVAILKLVHCPADVILVDDLVSWTGQANVVAAYLQLSTYNQSTYVLPRGGCCSGVVVDIGRGSDVESSTSHAESSTSHEWMDVSQSHGHQRTSRWSAAEALAAMMMMVVGVMMMMVVMVMMLHRGNPYTPCNQRTH